MKKTNVLDKSMYKYLYIDSSGEIIDTKPTTLSWKEYSSMMGGNSDLVKTVDVGTVKENLKSYELLYS